MYDKYFYLTKNTLLGGGYLPVYDAQGTQTGVTDVAPIESEFTVMKKDVTSMKKEMSSVKEQNNVIKTMMIELLSSRRKNNNYNYNDNSN